ncbi:MAG: hypothetical protein FWF25_04415 [Propionibacteriaceae bacterium]|nr:hypothetical protein [Propionibacteriaceae bacterium]
MKWGRYEALDLAEVVHADEVMPTAFMHLFFDGRINVPQLVQALDKVVAVVPEIICRADITHHLFEPLPLSAVDLITETDHLVSAGPLINPMSGPQIGILVGHGCDSDSIGLAFSHVLADGQAVQMFLGLLADYYNGLAPDVTNNRSIAAYLSKVRVGPATPAEEAANRMPGSALLPSRPGDQPYCPRVVVPGQVMAGLKARARRQRMTLNDVFLAGYVRVLCRLQDVTEIAVPCPADLRRVLGAEGLTVANMTTGFLLGATVNPGDTFNDTVAQVHAEMSLMRERNRCAASLQRLHRWWRMLPPRWTAEIVRRSYSILPVAYTNLGVIDETKFRFGQTTATWGTVTGTYRAGGCFLMSVTTIGTVTTLACALLGDETLAQEGEKVLHLVSHECEAWLDEPETQPSPAGSSATVEASSGER